MTDLRTGIETDLVIAAEVVVGTPQFTQTARIYRDGSGELFARLLDVNERTIYENVPCADWDAAEAQLMEWARVVIRDAIECGDVMEGEEGNVD